MKLTIDKAIFEKFPGVRLGVVVVLGVDNKKSEKILNFLRQEEKAAREKLSNTVISEHEFVAPWREVYRNFGSKPNEYSSSVEALAKRVQKDKELPDINPLVNLYNGLSLKYLLPFGGEDLDKVKGDIRLAFATGSETGKYIGSDETSSCYAGEVAYLDELGFICRRWNWREADRTKLTPETKNVVLVAEVLPPVSDAHLKQATEELNSLLAENLGGKTSIFYLDQQNQTLEINFITGTKLAKIEENASQSKTVAKEKNKNLKQQKEISKDKNRLSAVYSGSAKTIHDQLKKTLQNLGFSDIKISLEHPAVESHGDYSSNIALTTFERAKVQGLRDKGKTPREFAQTIVEKLQSNKELKKIVSKIDVAGPGFINFYFTKSALVDGLKQIDKKKTDFGEGKFLKGKKIMVEFTDPNPFKEFHIGHLFSNVVGEALSRLFASQGAIVKRVNYQGDVGMHVAKAVWGMMKLADEMLAESAPLTEKAKFMGKAYALGATKFEEDEQVKKEITGLNKEIYEQDPGIMELYSKGRKWSLDYFEIIYKRLGTKFDYYYFESVAGKVGLEFVKENLKEGIFQESQGVIVFPGEKYGLHTRVFVNSLGLPTYEAKDLGLAPTKYKDFKYDESVIVTGNEIDEYFKVLITALKQINPELGKKAHHISHGMVRLPEGKMSSRTGKVLTGEWLLDEVKKTILKLMVKPDSPFSALEREEITEKVAVGSIKYALLKAGTGHDVVFDFEKSISVDGNSGPYLQYTYARCCSVLQRSGITNYQLPITNYSPNSEELAILRLIYRFPEVVQTAAIQYSPNLVCTFLYELAQRFNTFYNKHRILEDNAQRSTLNAQIAFRLMLTSSVAQVLKNGLTLLGIQTPEKM
jgi:arginyl-tRNA synthetase